MLKRSGLSPGEIEHIMLQRNASEHAAMIVMLVRSYGHWAVSVCTSNSDETAHIQTCIDEKNARYFTVQCVLSSGLRCYGHGSLGKIGPRGNVRQCSESTRREDACTYLYFVIALSISDTAVSLF